MLTIIYMIFLIWKVMNRGWSGIPISPVEHIYGRPNSNQATRIFFYSGKETSIYHVSAGLVLHFGLREYRSFIQSCRFEASWLAPGDSVWAGSDLQCADRAPNGLRSLWGVCYRELAFLWCGDSRGGWQSLLPALEKGDRGCASISWLHNTGASILQKCRIPAPVFLLH